MKTITYRLTLEEPLLVTALDGDPNSAVSYDYIPGSVLRGVLIGLTMRANDLTELDAADETTRRRFFSHQTRFLNAYPVLCNKRSLPSPHTWVQDKYAQGADKNKITDQVFIYKDECEEDSPKKRKLKALRGRLVTFEAQGKVAIADMQRTISVHVQRDRRYGRSRGEDQGTIYRYEALSAGQVFEAAILCEDDADADDFKRLLEAHKTVSMGGARSAGYGRVAIGDAQKHDAWHETGEAPQRGEQIVITLLSDAVLRNGHGQHAADLESLCSALGITPDQVCKAYLARGAVGGFNRKWGLPLPQMPTLSMGSVLVLKKDTPLDLNLAERGIGERRNEGFGRIAIGWQRPERAALMSAEGEPTASVSEIKLNDASERLWRLMKKRIQRQETERDALSEARTLRLSVTALPKSQINRLRQIVLSVRLKPQSSLKSAIEEFLKDISDKRADKHFERARVDGKPMKKWLMDTAKENPDALILIDAVLERAIKEAGK
jgi:CRISPR-associated protein Csx10